MSLKELIETQGEVPIKLAESGKSRDAVLNDLDPLADYRVVVNFKGKKDTVFLGRMGKEDIYKELGENYILDKDILNDSNVEIYAQKINSGFGD